jgi:hypothetical protein
VPLNPATICIGLGLDDHFRETPLLAHLAFFSGELKDVSGPYVAGGTKCDALQRTFRCISSASMDDIESHIHSWRLSANLDSASTDIALSMKQEHATCTRRFCVSRKGYMGLEPEIAEPGDMTCIVFGVETPFVVRRKEGHCILIGECYVQ